MSCGSILASIFGYRNQFHLQLIPHITQYHQVSTHMEVSKPSKLYLSVILSFSPLYFFSFSPEISSTHLTSPSLTFHRYGDYFHLTSFLRHPAKFYLVQYLFIILESLNGCGDHPNLQHLQWLHQLSPLYFKSLFSL